MATTMSLTELRQRLFQLADQVIDSGEALLIERRGVRLRLIREDTMSETGGRLARLVRHEVVVGAPLAPYESPSDWNADGLQKVADPSSPGWRKSTRAAKPRAK